jgi:hypothetical protein
VEADADDLRDGFCHFTDSGDESRVDGHDDFLVGVFNFEAFAEEDEVVEGGPDGLG